MSDVDQSNILELTTDIVAAFVSKNAVRSTELPDLIASVHSALSGVGMAKPEPIPAKREPAVAIRKSISDEFIICLEDGRKFKSLKRHLGAAYGMTPDDYRTKWGLPRDYPMVAPGYAAARSNLAREMGLGRKSQAAAVEPELVVEQPKAAADVAEESRVAAAKTVKAGGDVDAMAVASKRRRPVKTSPE